MKVKVRCVKNYYDLELNTLITPSVEDKNYERIITRERADEIIDKTDGAVEIIETVKEDKKEKATITRNNSKKQPKKETAVR